MSLKYSKLPIHISPTARAGLMHQAFVLGYLSSPKAKNARGVSAYINAIGVGDFEDTRPIHIKEYHEQELVANWSCEEYRPQTRLRLAPLVILNMYKYGLEHGIVNPRVVSEQPPASSILGYMLEAIGIEWLTPINPPKKVSLHERV